MSKIDIIIYARNVIFLVYANTIIVKIMTEYKNRRSNLLFHITDLLIAFYTMKRILIILCILLFSDYFHQYSLTPLSIKFTIKYLFPWSKIKFCISNSYDNLSSH